MIFGYNEEGRHCEVQIASLSGRMRSATGKSCGEVISPDNIEELITFIK